MIQEKKPLPASSAASPGHRRSVLLALCWYDYRMHRGVARYAQEHDWILHSEMAHNGTIPQGWNGDGILSLIGTEKKSKELLAFVQKAGRPTVNLGMEKVPGCTRLQSAFFDTRAAGRLAARHFLERNFRNFACYVENRDQVNVTLSETFQATIREAGFDCQIHWWRRRGGEEWLKERKRQEAWLRAAKNPLAVFAVSDLLAIRVMASCQEIGLRIPEDVAVLGCHNDDMDCLSAPIPLSSIETNEEQLGYEAAARLDRLMSGKVPQVELVLIAPSGVVTRRSTDILATSHPAVQKVQKFIREHYAKPIRTEDLARLAGMSRFGLEKAFKTQLNRLPIQELRRIRIEAAQRLLLETDHKIETIAQAAGFRDATAIGVAFRRVYGLSPKAWRRRESAILKK